MSEQEVSEEKLTEIKKKITAAEYNSNPDAPHVKTLYDSTGRWILEIYTVGHTIVERYTDLYMPFDIEDWVPEMGWNEEDWCE